jgi:hypothetical protein
MRIATLLTLLVILGCSKKKEEAPAAPPAAPSVSATATASVEKVVDKPVEDVGVDAPDDAIESEFVAREDLVLPEGKPIALGKIVPATKDAIKEHAAKLQTEFEEQVADGCKEIGRFNASFVPATYVACKKNGKPAKDPVPAIPDEWRLIEVEGTNVAIRNYVDSASTGQWELWNTPRGYFVDIGDGRFTYILRRTERVKNDKVDGNRFECVGKSWSPTDGTVEEAKVPDYPTRGKDVDGDGKPEFPASAFSWSLEGFVQSVSPKADNTCNIVIDDRVSIDVLGLVSGGDRAFFEHRLRDARARATKAAKRADVARKKGSLRFTNACAIDLAQIAAEVFAYQRILGAAANDAIVEADAVMKDRALRAGECGGLSNKGGDGANDQWPAMRTALISWNPTTTFAPSDAGVDAAHD